MSSSSVMERHALAILPQQDLWKSPILSGKYGAKFQAIAPKFLYLLIVESQRLGGSVLDQFWERVGKCNQKLEENIEHLKSEDFVSPHMSFEVLFKGLDPKHVDFGPVLAMARAFFVYLGVVFMNPAELESGASTEFSVSDVVDEEKDKLLQRLSGEEEFSKRNQEILKALSFKRDGQFCLLTCREFRPFDRIGIHPALMRIIPNSVGKQQATLDCIDIFAGAVTRYDIVHNLNEIGNVMNAQLDAHVSHNKLEWGIEAKEEGGEVEYYFRMIPSPTDPDARAPGIITLKEGDELHFGKGPSGEELDNGPLPRLCNLQLAVARVVKISGASDIILEWMDDADDDASSLRCSLIAAEI